MSNQCQTALANFTLALVSYWSSVFFDICLQFMWPTVIHEFYGYFLFHCHGSLAEQLAVRYTRRLWEVSLGKYDNWCLFIVIEICSTAQWNTTPQRLWLPAPGSKTSMIIQTTTASSVIQQFLMFYARLRVSAHSTNLVYFPLCVPRTQVVFFGGMGQREAFGWC